MTNNPAITVLMAVFNGGRFLTQAIDSVLAQTFTSFELLIIDDGSTDNSQYIIKQYQDPRIRLLNNNENEGLVYTRNRGIQEVRTEFVAILDCDDIALANRLEIQYKFFKNNPNVALCSGRAMYIDSNGNSIGETPVISGYRNEQLLFGNFLVNSAVMARTDIIKAVGSYKANAPAEDYDLAMRISATYRIEMINTILVKYRIHENNVSKQNLTHQKEVEKNILRDFHTKFNIKSNNLRVELHHSLISGNLQGFTLKDYEDFFMDLLQNADVTDKYNYHALRTVLFNKWFEVVSVKQRDKSLTLLFNSPLYSSTVITFKQLRKAFKNSLKGLLK